MYELVDLLSCCRRNVDLTVNTTHESLEIHNELP